LLICAAGFGALGLHAWRYYPFFADDAFISLRYARRLLDGLGLTWSDGAPVEGYSNLLWVLLTAALGALGVELVLAARVLGFTLTCVALAAVARLHWPRAGRDMLPPAFALLALAACGPVAVWTIGGLEQPLVAALLAWAMASLLGRMDQDGQALRNRHLTLPSLLLGLLCLTRPDGPVLVAGAALGIVLALGVGRRSLRLAVVLGTLPLLMVACQLAFRLHYYDDWLPNPARVKVAFTSSRVLLGAGYVWWGVFTMAGLAIPAAGAILAAVTGRLGTGRRARVLLLTSPLVLWLAYLVMVGGDIFPAWRRLAPAAVLMALLAAELLGHLLEHGARGARLAAWLSAPALLAVLLTMQLQAFINQAAIRERWEWHGQSMGNMLRQAFGEGRPLLAVEAAGALPYYAGLPALDMYGLNDRHIARQRGANFGDGALAHELGDGRYVFRRRPDLLVFGLPFGADFATSPSSAGLFEMPRFKQVYRPVRFKGRDPIKAQSVIWVKKWGGPVGARRTPRRIWLPGYQLADNLQSIARLDNSGRVGMTTSAAIPARLNALRIPAGRWRLRVSSSGKPVKVRAWRKSLTLGSGPPPLELEVPPGPGSTSVLVWPAEGTAHLREVVLEKL